MRIETIAYFGHIVAETRDSFPMYVDKAMMIKHGHHLYGSYMVIDAEHHEAVIYLDNLFKEQIAEGKCWRTYNIEINKKEIPNYSHFSIRPYNLYHGTQLFCSVKQPTCEIDGCMEGAKLISKVVLKKKRSSKLDIGIISYTHNKDIVLFISARLKRIFDLEGVTGLIYEKAKYIIKPRRRSFTKDGVLHCLCKETGKPEDDPAPGAEEPFIARLKYAIYGQADEIRTKFFPVISETPALYCTIHSYLSPHATFPGYMIPSANLGNWDFIEVQGVKVDGHLYNYRFNEFIVSRKILEILIKCKAKGLRNMGVFLRTTFRPLT
jgi:hypothetical protein